MIYRVYFAALGPGISKLARTPELNLCFDAASRTLQLKGSFLGKMKDRLWDRTTFNRICKKWLSAFDSDDPDTAGLQIMLFFWPHAGSKGRHFEI
jgi:hypothetical protein